MPSPHRYGTGRAPMAARFDRLALTILLLLALAVGARVWLHDHPEHNPWAPLRLDHPLGWATDRKIARLRGDPGECRAFLDRSSIAFEALAPAGEGACRRNDRVRLLSGQMPGLVLRPSAPPATCAIQAGLALWLRHGLQPEAKAVLGSPVASIRHLGVNACRRIGGGEQGRWSEHATGNAIDIAAFVLEDGRQMRVARDWPGEDEKAVFLRQARESACRFFGTVLSPDYNAAHSDHFHLDQAGRAAGWSYCR